MNHYPIYLFDSMRHVQGQVMAMGGVWPEVGQDADVASNRSLDGAQALFRHSFPPGALRRYC